MTDGIRDTVKRYTGHEPRACPWAALRDPFVYRVISSVGPAEDGNLSTYLPSPSHRLLDGIGFYRRIDASIHAQQLKAEREASRG